MIYMFIVVLRQVVYIPRAITLYGASNNNIIIRYKN